MKSPEKAKLSYSETYTIDDELKELLKAQFDIMPYWLERSTYKQKAIKSDACSW